VPLPTDQEQFDRAFQRWLRTGGVDPEGSRVMWERFYRGLDRHVPTKCKHGLTVLTCAECNLEYYKGGNK
jgi:hypothetical protein